VSAKRGEERPPGFATRPATVLAGTMAVQMTAVMAGHSLVVIAPAVADALAIDAALIGYQISIVYFGAMLSVVFGGSLVRRHGACRTSQFALGCSAAGVALAAAGCALPSHALIALGSLLMGFGTGPATPAASHLLAHHTDPASRNLIFSIKQTGVPLGVVAAAVVVPPLALALGIAWALLAVALLALALIVALQPLRAAWDADREPAAALGQQPFGGLPTVLGWPPLRWLAVGAFFYGFVQICVTSFTVTMLVREIGIGLLEAAFVLSLVQLAGVVSRLVVGTIADRMGQAMTLLMMVGATTAVMCVATTLLAADWPRAAIYAFAVALGASAVGWTGLFAADVARVAPRGQIGLATSGAFAFSFLGILTGPALFAVVYQMAGSYTLTFGLLMAVSVAGVAFVALARRADLASR
jgi:MFS family permease